MSSFKEQYFLSKHDDKITDSSKELNVNIMLVITIYIQELLLPLTKGRVLHWPTQSLDLLINLVETLWSELPHAQTLASYILYERVSDISLTKEEQTYS